MTRYKLTLEYDGTGVAGWQIQKDQPSMQGFLEKAIYRFAQEEVQTIVAGRTDAGVHARGQVVHFDLTKERTPYQIMHGINHHLLDQERPLIVLDVEAVHADFNARFDAKSRTYYFFIVNRQAPLTLDKHRVWKIHTPLDLDAMREAAGYLIGKHDFTSFRSIECQSNSPVKTLDTIEIKTMGSRIGIKVQAKSFLHHMVRNIVGTLSLVGEGKWQPEQVRYALEAKDRKQAGPTAPAHGLYLWEVEY